MARSQLGTTHSPAGLLTSPGDGEGSRTAHTSAVDGCEKCDLGSYIHSFCLPVK